jgi:hypothetical protein
METAKTLYRYGDDYFDYRLARMHDHLKELAAIMERQHRQRPPIETRVIYQPVFYPSVPEGKKRKPVLHFPFTILLGALDRSVERFVKTVVARWITRIKHVLRPQKR